MQYSDPGEPGGGRGAAAGRRRNAVDPLALKPGDLVVHSQRGIGRHVDMVQRTSGGATHEYLVVEYAPSKRNQPASCSCRWTRWTSLPGTWAVKCRR